MSSKIFILIAGLFVGIAVDRVLLQLSDDNVMSYGSRRLQQRSEGVRRAICHQRVDRLEMEVESLRMHPRIRHRWPFCQPQLTTRIFGSL